MPTRLLLLSLLVAAPLAAQTPAAKPAPPATLRSILLSQLRSTHNKAEWFVPLNTAVEGVTPDQAKWIPHSERPNPAPADHSIGMIANHILFWNAQALARMKDAHAPQYNGSNDETFNKWDAASWATTVTKLDQVLTDLETFVASADEATLQRNASQIAHINTHNAYHTGQIIEIRKLQGSWNPEKGVK